MEKTKRRGWEDAVQKKRQGRARRRRGGGTRGGRVVQKRRGTVESDSCVSEPGGGEKVEGSGSWLCLLFIDTWVYLNRHLNFINCTKYQHNITYLNAYFVNKYWGCLSSVSSFPFPSRFACTAASKPSPPPPLVEKESKTRGKKRKGKSVLLPSVRRPIHMALRLHGQFDPARDESLRFSHSNSTSCSSSQFLLAAPSDDGYLCWIHR